MRTSSTPPAEQLRLFDVPALAGISPRSRARRRGTPLRAVLTVVALGVATAGIMAGSFAAWTAQTSNTGNSVAAGTLTMTNDKNATSLFTATGAKPGDAPAPTTVTVANTGSLPMSVTLTQGTVVNGFDPASLGLEIYDSTRGWCVWPTQSAGACGSYGAWSGSPLTSGISLPATSGASQWPSGQSHTFEVSWQLAASSPNSDQGKSASFQLVWDGLQ
jgi:hypothetical protein